MSSMSMTIGVGFVDPFEKIRAFFSLSKAAEHVLRRGTLHTVRHLFESLHAIVDQAVQSGSLEEFTRRREEAIHSYANLIHAISLIAQTEISEKEFPLLARDSLNCLHQEFVSLGITDLGADAAEQVSFCIFTLKKIFRLLPRLASSPVHDADQSRDRELSIQFVGCILLAHFHLYCTRTVLKHRMEIPPSVMGAVLEGLDASSLAYQTIRQGMELRAVPELGLTDDVVWDDEDQVLLDESEQTGLAIT
ncbi:MAG TPA: hypothetical protein VEU96_21480 [Bryobacteraceae bacterium]|nr:hypothetical protein [Bryobacteraceae bacterium]